jgi:hypothetical protein
MNSNKNSPNNQNINLAKNEKEEDGYFGGNIYTMNFADDNKITRYFQNNDSDDEEEKINSGISLPNLNNNNINKNNHNINQGLEYNKPDKEKNEELLQHSESHLEIVDDGRRSLFQRVLGPVDAGSIRGSIFNLTIFCLGSGCLNMSQKIGQMSLLFFVVDMILSGLATYMTLNLLILSSKKAKTFNYSEVVENYLGKIASYILTIACLINNFGVIILYMVISNY